MTQTNKELTKEQLEHLQAIESILSEKEDLTDEEAQQLQQFFKNS
jgi:hypothetical protein